MATQDNTHSGLVISEAWPPEASTTPQYHQI